VQTTTITAQINNILESLSERLFFWLDILKQWQPIRIHYTLELEHLKRQTTKLFIFLVNISVLIKG